MQHLDSNLISNIKTNSICNGNHCVWPQPLLKDLQTAVQSEQRPRAADDVPRARDFALIEQMRQSPEEIPGQQLKWAIARIVSLTI